MIELINQIHTIKMFYMTEYVDLLARIGPILMLLEVILELSCCIKL